MRFDILQELGFPTRWKQRPARAVKLFAESPDPPPPGAHENEIGFTTKNHQADSPVGGLNWEDLRRMSHACQKCPLCQNRRNVVFGVGDTQANILFVGEGPGQEEDRLGEPFVGAAGKLLDKMLAAIRQRRDDGVYITNIVKCRPPDNRNPTPAESTACLPYLHRQIELIKPRLIVALGRVAAAHLLQNNKTIGELRQRMQDYNGVPLVVTYHPAYLLRNPIDKRKSWEDLRHIRRLAAD